MITGRPNGITDREKIFRINFAFRNRYRYKQRLFWNSFFVADTDTVVLCSFDTADQNCFGHNVYFIADTDTEKY